MNKYQEALNKIKNMGDKDLYNERHLEWCDILQELVDKATPKKIKLFPNSFYIKICPNCGSTLETRRNYCDECGQKLDWGEDND